MAGRPVRDARSDGGRSRNSEVSASAEPLAAGDRRGGVARRLAQRAQRRAREARGGQRAAGARAQLALERDERVDRAAQPGAHAVGRGQHAVARAHEPAQRGRAPRDRVEHARRVLSMNRCRSPRCASRVVISESSCWAVGPRWPSASLRSAPRPSTDSAAHLQVAAQRRARLGVERAEDLVELLRLRDVGVGDRAALGDRRRVCATPAPARRTSRRAAS